MDICPAMLENASPFSNRSRALCALDSVSTTMTWKFTNVRGTVSWAGKERSPRQERNRTLTQTITRANPAGFRLGNSACRVGGGADPVDLVTAESGRPARKRIGATNYNIHWRFSQGLSKHRLGDAGASAARK